MARDTFEPIRVLHYLGYFGPKILLVLSVFLLLQKKMICAVYLAGFFLNIIVNSILKTIIREPRPSNRMHQFTLDFNETYTDVDKLGEHEFGMPSGHSQSVFYSAAFIHFSIKKWWISLICFMIALNTMYQRVLYKNHTILQVCVGAIIGIFMAKLVYQYFFGIHYIS